MRFKNHKAPLVLSSLFILLAGCSGQASSLTAQVSSTDASTSISGAEGYTVMKETEFLSLSGVKQYLSSIKTEDSKVYVVDDAKISESLAASYKVSATEDTRRPGVPISLFSIASTLTEKSEATSDPLLLLEAEPSEPGEVSIISSSDALLVVRVNGKDVAIGTSPNKKATFDSVKTILENAGEYW